jgi:hypothetical protein
MVRLLTGGAVRSAPLIYDLVCGEVPSVDPPVVLMAQAMLQLPWTYAVDGSPLYQAMVQEDPAVGAHTASGQVSPGAVPPVASTAAPALSGEPAALLSALLMPRPNTNIMSAAVAPTFPSATMAGPGSAAALLSAMLSAAQRQAPAPATTPAAPASGVALLTSLLSGCLAASASSSQVGSQQPASQAAASTSTGPEKKPLSVHSTQQAAETCCQTDSATATDVIKQAAVAVKSAGGSALAVLAEANGLQPQLQQQAAAVVRH